MTTPRKHKHAELIKQWLDDDSLIVEVRCGEEWQEVSQPVWYKTQEYRIKTKMIRCGDMEFPEPMRIAPETNALYWVVDIGQRSIVYRALWQSTDYTNILLKRGMCHATKEAAEAHARALIALTEVKE